MHPRFKWASGKASFVFVGARSQALNGRTYSHESRWATGEVSLALAGGALASGKASGIALEVWRRKRLLRCLTAWQTWLGNAKWKERANALAE